MHSERAQSEIGIECAPLSAQRLAYRTADSSRLKPIGMTGSSDRRGKIANPDDLYPTFAVLSGGT